MRLSAPVRPNLVMMILPTAISISSLSRIAGFIAISLILVAVLIPAESTNGRLNPTWACAFLPVGALWIALRPNYPNSLVDALLFTVTIVTVAYVIHISNSRASALSSLHDGLGIFLVTSVTLQLSGFWGTLGQTAGGNVLTGGNRILFPLTSSLVTAPTVAAVYVVAFLPMIKTTSRYQVPRLLAVVAASYVIIQADRRSALFATVLIAASVMVFPALFRRLAPSLIGLSLATPLIFGMFPGIISSTLRSLTQSLPDSLTRDGESTGTLNGRFGIWSLATHFYRYEVGGFRQMFGFGTFGNIESGAATLFYSNFSGHYRERVLKGNPHSSLLQLLFDGGWIVAIGLATVVIYSAWLMSRRNSTSDVAGLAMLTTLALVGLSEASLSPTNAQLTWWTLVIIVTIALSREQLHPSWELNERRMAGGEKLNADGVS